MSVATYQFTTHAIVRSMVSYAQHRDRLRAAIRERLTPALKGYRTCALLDFLSVYNPGDALLEDGARAFLAENGIDVVYEADWITFDERSLRRLLPEGGLIVFHGGGNINDLNWRDLNVGFRLDVLSNLRDYRVVQLPQSVSMADPGLLERVHDAFANHPDAHLFVRDRRSVEFCAERLQVTATLCPDMAFAVELGPAEGSPRDLVTVFRHDNEAKKSASADPRFRSWRRVYWLRKYGFSALLFYALHALLIVLRTLRLRVVAAPLARGIAVYARRFSRAQCRFIIRALGSARVVVTDRLHAVVSCILMDRPFVALDNSYGKIHTFLETWMPELVAAHTARSSSEAYDKAMALLQRNENPSQ